MKNINSCNCDNKINNENLNNAMFNETKINEKNENNINLINNNDDNNDNINLNDDLKIEIRSLLDFLYDINKDDLKIKDTINRSKANNNIYIEIKNKFNKICKNITILIYNENFINKNYLDKKKEERSNIFIIQLEIYNNINNYRVDYKDWYINQLSGKDAIDEKFNEIKNYINDKYINIGG